MMYFLFTAKTRKWRMMELLFPGCSQSCMNHSSQALGWDLCCYSMVVVVVW